MPDWETVKSRLPVELTKEDGEKRRALWRDMNLTGSKYLQLFELEEGIRKVLGCDELFCAKPCIARAHKYAREVNPNGPSDKLEFCEFRMLLIYLKGLFEVYQLFRLMDKSQDMRLSLNEIRVAGPVLAARGVVVNNLEGLYWASKGTNDDIDFNEFADWATRQGLAGKELQDVAGTDVTEELQTTLSNWKLCCDGRVSRDDLLALLKCCCPCSEQELTLVLDKVAGEDGRVCVKTFIELVCPVAVH